MDTASKKQAEDFLKRLVNKIELSNYKVIFEDADSKDLATLLKLELLSEYERLQHICKLTYKDYSQGPLEDNIHGGAYWVFGKIIKGKEVYIKINIGFKNKPVIIISFHFSERKMNYPLK